MAKQKDKTIKNEGIPGFWWVGSFALIFLVLGMGILLNYQNTIWQMADAIVENIFFSLRNVDLTPKIIFITNFGYYGTILIWLLIYGLLVVGRKWQIFKVSIWTSIGGIAFGYGLKVLVSRSRPLDLPLISETSNSFPSLHALTAIILYLTIAYLVYHFSRRFLLSYLVFVLGLIITLAIGFSRIYLGVHYFSDVVGGFLLGMGWMLTVLFGEKSVCNNSKKAHKSALV